MNVLLRNINEIKDVMWRCLSIEEARLNVKRVQENCGKEINQL